MTRVRKRWVLLGIICVVLTLWAWDMVDDFRQLAQGHGQTGSSTSRAFEARDETMGRPLRVFHGGIPAEVLDALRAINLRSSAMVLSGSFNLSEADTLVVSVDTWRTVDAGLPPALAAMILPNLLDREESDQAAYFSLSRAGGPVLPVMAVNRSALLGWPALCQGLLIHDSVRLWDGDAGFFAKMTKSRAYSCARERWTSLPPNVAKF